MYIHFSCHETIRGGGPFFIKFISLVSKSNTRSNPYLFNKYYEFINRYMLFHVYKLFIYVTQLTDLTII